MNVEYQITIFPSLLRIHAIPAVPNGSTCGQRVVPFQNHLEKGKRLIRAEHGHWSLGDEQNQHGRQPFPDRSVSKKSPFFSPWPDHCNVVTCVDLTQHYWKFLPKCTEMPKVAASGFTCNSKFKMYEFVLPSVKQNLICYYRQCGFYWIDLALLLWLDNQGGQWYGRTWIAFNWEDGEELTCSWTNNSNAWWVNGVSGNGTRWRVNSTTEPLHCFLTQPHFLILFLYPSPNNLCRSNIN